MVEQQMMMLSVHTTSIAALTVSYAENKECLNQIAVALERIKSSQHNWAASLQTSMTNLTSRIDTHLENYTLFIQEYQPIKAAVINFGWFQDKLNWFKDKLPWCLVYIVVVVFAVVVAIVFLGTESAKNLWRFFK